MMEREYGLVPWKRCGGNVLRQKCFAGAGGNILPLLTFPLLSQCKFVSHCFTTRAGGVSQGVCSSLNLSFSRGDAPQAVQENFRRVAEAFGVTPEHIVCSMQTHTTNVRRVGRADCGAGVTRPLPWSDVDGLITDEPGVLLATFYADCIPLYFVDPVHRALGLSHSGWRGTVNKMGKVTLDCMAREYGTKPEDVQVAIAPSICQDCYEVSEDVALAFEAAFVRNDDMAREYLSRYQKEISERDIENCLFYKKENGKYQLNLWYANFRVFRDAGVPNERIEVTDVCTCCNPKLLFSHRASKGRRGNLGAFMMLK